MNNGLWQVWARDRGIGKRPYKVGDPVPQSEAFERVGDLKKDPKVSDAWMDDGQKVKRK